MGGSTNSKPVVREVYARNLQVRIENPLFLDENSSDAVLFVESLTSDKSRYPLHKDVLRKEIPSLMLDGDSITINYPKPQDVEQVLRYVYEKHVHFTDWKNACNVLEVASQYPVSELSKECEQFLVENIRLRNACVLLDLALRHSLTNLKLKCSEFCRMAGFIVMRTRAFKEGSKPTVSYLACMPDINVESELSVFRALWDWCIVDSIRKVRNLNENTIAHVFSQEMAPYVGFQFMSNDEKESLPASVRKLFNEGISSRLATKAGRSITDFMLDDVCATVQFECKVPAVELCPRGNNIPCYKFSLNVDSYLLEVNTISLLEGKQIGSVSRLKIVGPTNVDFAWDKGLDKVYFENVGQQHHRASEQLDDASTVVETRFRSVHLLLLRAGVVYSIEIEPDDVKTKWPLCQAYIAKHNQSDVKITQTSEACAGLQSLKFLQAY